MNLTKCSLHMILRTLVAVILSGALSLSLVQAQVTDDPQQPDVLRAMPRTDAPPPTQVAPGIVLLRLDNAKVTAAQITDLATAFPQIQSAQQNATLPDLYEVRVPVGSEQKIAAELSSDPRVLLAEPDYIFHTTATPSDPLYDRYQWNLRQIRADQAWDQTVGSSDVIIAVLDTGVDLTHPDLVGKLVPGYDFANNDNDPSDDQGHGTHVAGIAAASSNNGIGIAGVSWSARLMPIKVLNTDGSGRSSDIAEGIVWATDQGADIINLSLGAIQYATVVADAVRYAHERGALVIAASGNYYKDGNPIVYPAALNHVLAVAAVNDSDGHASYSSSGSYVDIAAPGGDPADTTDGDNQHWIPGTYLRARGASYAWLSGTSQAAPQVAGIAALLLALDPSLSPDQVVGLLTHSAVDVESPGWDELSGYGRIDALAAIQALYNSMPTVTPTATTLPTPTPTNTPQPTPTPAATTVPRPREDTRINSTVDSYQSDAAINADSSGALSVIWRDGRNGGESLFSAHLGPTALYWGPNFSLDGATQSAGTQTLSPPALVSDAQNNLHAVWVSTDDSGSSTLFYSRQAAGTTSWQSAPATALDGSIVSSVQPALTLAADGTLIAAWEQADPDSQSATLFWSQRTPGSTQWSAPAQIDDDSVAQKYEVALAADGDRVLAVWVSRTEGNASLEMASLSQGTTTWSAPVTITTLNPNTTAYTPDLAVSLDGTVLLAWADLGTQEQGQDIFVIRRAAGQGNWSSPVRVNADKGNADQSSPSLAVNATTVTLVWEDNSHDVGDVYIAWSDLGQPSWTASRRVNQDKSGARQQRPDVAMDRWGNVTVVWSDYRTGIVGPEIYTRFIPAAERFQIFLSQVQKR